MNRIIVFTLIMALSGIATKAQNIDERIGSAMNSSDFFGLYDIYHSTPKDSINPFLEVFSRCLIGNRFNRPDISIPAFDELLKKQSENLDLNLLLSSAMMYSRDLSRVGRNEDAYQLLSAVLSSAYQAVDSTRLTPYANFAAQYKSLTKYSPYQINIAGDCGIIPFDTIRTGKEDSQQFLMQITDAHINGSPVRITFDTGAGVNVITDSLAKAFGLVYLDANVAATGVKSSDGRYAIAKELKLGNITVKDVPFYVIDVSSHHEEADKYLSVLDFIVGSELMLQLKDVTIDFSAKEIQASRTISRPTNVRPNMCFSSENNLLASARINQQPMLIRLDSGDASYGWLNKMFFEANKDYLTSHCQSDTVNLAGVGGVWSVLCYKLQDATLTIGGNSVKVPLVQVQTEQQVSGYLDDNNLGLKSMMLFRKVRFNFVDMVFSTEL